MNICSIEGCENRAVGRGWCHKHYRRWKNNGDPMTVKRISGPMPLRERFDLQYVSEPETGCWLWVGQTGANGYGRIKRNRKTLLAHRISYEIFVGPIPDGMAVCHKCDVRRCVNPDHLFIGTFRDNTVDSIKKGRRAHLHGENSPSNILSTENAIDIASCRETAKEASKRYGVSEHTVWDIRAGRRWSKTTGINANQRRGNI